MRIKQPAPPAWVFVSSPVHEPGAADRSGVSLQFDPSSGDSWEEEEEEEEEFDDQDFDEDFDEDFDQELDEEFERELQERFDDENFPLEETDAPVPPEELEEELAESDEELEEETPSEEEEE